MTELDRDHFDEVLSFINNHSEWTFREDWQDLEGKIEDAAGGETVDISYDHQETSGVLKLNVRPHEDIVVSGLLSQPLHRDMPESSSGFVGELNEALSSTAERHETEYLDPVEGTIYVSSLNVPVDYDEDELETALTEAGEASEEVEEMYDNLIGITKDYQ